MSSTPANGEPQQHNADDLSHKYASNIPDEADKVELARGVEEERTDIDQEDVDTIPQLNVQPETAIENSNGIVSSDLDLVRPDLRLTESSIQDHSVADSGSIPDDTPSFQGSGISSPRSEGISSLTPSTRNVSTPPRRPFDLRFQSRLSSSYSGSLRPASPGFLDPHSRHSSFASLRPPSQSEVDESSVPWDVIRWNRLRRLKAQVFAEASVRNFGTPTCMAVTNSIVVGTSRGLVHVFDYQRGHGAIIGSGTQASESGPVTALAISADHTTVAVGHSSGHIFTWEVSRPSRPFLHIPPLNSSQPEARKGDGHIQGSAVLHVGFLGYRRTALVSADDKGMAFSHLASRGTGAIARSIRTTRILGRYPELIMTRSAKSTKRSSVLAFSPLPLGNVEQSVDGMGLVAMLTPYLLVIVSTTPVAQTQHKAARPKELAAHGAMTAALAWFPAIKLKGTDSDVSKPKLVYAWSDVLTILEVHEVLPEEGSAKDKPPELQFIPRSRFQAEEAIVGVQWLSRSVIAVLTITQQLLILEDGTMTVTDAFDLLSKDIYHADLYSHQLQAVIEDHDEGENSMHGVVADGYHMSFRAYKGRLFVLGFQDVWWGSLTNWADRLLAMMEVGDFIGAIRLATRYYAGQGETVTIGLPEDDATRFSLVRDKLLGLMSASLKHAFGHHGPPSETQLGGEQLAELAEACMTACMNMGDRDFLFDEVFTWFDENQSGTILVDVLEPYILDGQITVLPPAAVKTLVNHFAVTHSAPKLEELICLLDATEMDLDQVTTLCKQHHLYDAYIYVWNTALRDYQSPLEELINQVSAQSGMDGQANGLRAGSDAAHKIFAYLSFVLTGRIYPTGASMDDSEATVAKLQIYNALFSGQDSGASPFATLRQILHIDAASFMRALNEAFEDSFLNLQQDENVESLDRATLKSGDSTIFNRQTITKILIEVMSTGFGDEDTIYLDMFVARNLPKYRQYIVLSGSLLTQSFTRLCGVQDEGVREDAQLSVEYLMTVYQPPNVLSFVPLLRTAKFFRVLKSVFRQERRWADLVETYFDDHDDPEGVFGVLTECLRPRSTLTGQQRAEVVGVAIGHAGDLAQIDVNKTAVVVQNTLPDKHRSFLEAQEFDPNLQFRYLRSLLEPDDGPPAPVGHGMIEQYIRLMCRYETARVADYVTAIREGDLQLDAVVPAMEANGIIDAAVVLLVQQGEAQRAMQRLVRHMSALSAALTGILRSADDSPDVVVTNEAIEDLLESVTKYAQVGVWLCNGQSRATQRSKSVTKSPRRGVMQEPLGLDETFWLELLVSVVSITQQTMPARNASPPDDHPDEVTSTLRRMIQNVFTALLTTTSGGSDGPKSRNDLTFLRILRAFLSRVAQSSPSLSQLRDVIGSIFSAYAHEESLLSLSHAMLDKDLFVHVDEVSRLRRMGWRPRGQACETCRRRVWGPGAPDEIWEAWQRREKARQQPRSLSEMMALNEEEEVDSSRGKGKAAVQQPTDPVNEEVESEEDSTRSSDPGPLVVFSCRHLFHRKCLGQSQSSDGQETGTPTHDDQGRLACPLCT